MTLLCCVQLSACNFLSRQLTDQTTETCKFRAYVHQPIEDWLNSRYQAKSPVRVAIIPFSVPANFTTESDERTGLDLELATVLQQELLRRGSFPIVEVFNRQSWPGKKEEFFKGNFGAISLAREASYDLVLVGLLEPLRSIDEITAYSKLIEVESGLTLWFGRVSANSARPDLRLAAATLGLTNRRPDLLSSAALSQELAGCIAGLVSAEEELLPGR